ncbi:MAG: MATE family efflux transporter [Myxococcota bacterium]|nr:MATE family efflux transporter [Myxococcota bacterium]
MPSTTAAPEPVLDERRIFSELVRLSWPIAISVLSYSLMTFVDTYFVARLGAASVGGVGIGGVAAFTTLCFALGVLRAVKVLISQEAGAGRKDSVQAYLGAGLWLAFGFGVASTLLAWPLAKFLPSLSSGPSGAIAASYLSIRALGTLPVILQTALREARYGIGDSRTPMYGALFANLIHIPLNYLFIFSFGWGVEGAAWSTVSIQVLELAWLARVHYPTGFGLRLARPSHAVHLLRVGVSTGLEFFLGVSAFSVIVALIARMSEADLAAHQIGIQLIHFAFLPVVAVGEAGSVLAGQAVGSDRDRLVPIVARRALGLAGGYAALCTLLFALGPELLLSGFSAEARVREIGVHLLWIAAGFQLFDAVNLVLRAVLRGTGDVRVPTLQAVLSGWALTPTLTWWLGIHHGLGAAGGWLALSADIAFGAAFLSIRTWLGAWRPSASASRQRIALSNAAAGA